MSITEKFSVLDDVPAGSPFWRSVLSLRVKKLLSVSQHLPCSIKKKKVQPGGHSNLGC